MIEAEVERYSDPHGFAREVNLPLLGTARIEPVPSGPPMSRLLEVAAPPELETVLEGLTETRRSLTLRSLLLAGFPEDRECFTIGLALARAWSRRGLKIAVVDLDFWNPTVVRPRPNPNEGLVDVLEYGCSFRRVAWEIVAGGLWVVGPGSYPPDPHKIVEHPDWERAARSFASHVDVTLYVAPLLERSGFVGRLSKRMDGVLLAASVERIARTDLRDAFLELWGSDAPMIGIIGIEGAPAGSREEMKPVAESAGVASVTIAEPEWIGAHEWIGQPAPVDVPYAEPERVSYGDADGRESPPSAPAWSPAMDDSVERELASILQREVELGRPLVKPIRRSRAGLYAGVAAGLAVAASIVAVLMRHPTLPPSPEVMPAGTEEVLPAPTESPSAVPGSASASGLEAATIAPSQGATTAPPAAAVAGAGAGPANATSKPPQTNPTPPHAPSMPQQTSPAPTKASSMPPQTKSTTPLAAASGARPFRVHVASFKSEDKVAEIVRSLKAKGADAYYEKATDVPGYYRVFVGHFATEKEAAAQAQKLLDQGWVDRAQAFPLTAR